MTIISIIAICLAVLCAFLFGRSAVVSDQRNNSNKQLKSEVAKLNHRLDRIANSSEFDRCYEIEEDEDAGAYNVNLKVYIRVYSYACEHIDTDTVCCCLIKQFPFDEDKEFAKNEAEELLDKLNEP